MTVVLSTLLKWGLYCNEVLCVDALVFSLRMLSGWIAACFCMSILYSANKMD